MGGATKISNAFSKDVFSNINNICVVINGVEYSSIAKSYATNQTYVYVDDKIITKNPGVRIDSLFELVTECLKTGVVRDFKLIVENTTQKVLVSFVDGAVTVVTSIKN